MSANEQPIGTAEEEFDAIVPDGWTGGDGADIFDPSTWGDGVTAADAQEDDYDQEDGNSAEGEDYDVPTTDDDDSPQNGTDDSEDVPTTDDEYEDITGPLVFQANIDHKVEEVELDPADLPTIYQKSRALDRYQQRVAELEAENKAWDAIAAGLQFENREELRQGLIENAVQDYISEHPAVPEEMARDFVMRKFETAQPSRKASEEEQTNQRDFRAEVAELFRDHPEARAEKLPTEVSEEAIMTGKPLAQVYAEWKARTASAEATRAKRENKILKQNQAAAARAPVRKTTGGGKTDTSPVDAFLRGFNDDGAW